MDSGQVLFVIILVCYFSLLDIKYLKYFPNNDNFKLAGENRKTYTQI